MSRAELSYQVLEWSVKITIQNESVKLSIIYYNGISKRSSRKCQIPHCPTFPMDQHWVRWISPGVGNHLTVKSLKQKALAVLWIGVGVGAEQDEKGRTENRKLLSNESEYRKSVFEASTPLDKEVSAEASEKSIYQSPSIKMPLNGDAWTGNV